VWKKIRERMQKYDRNLTKEQRLRFFFVVILVVIQRIVLKCLDISVINFCEITILVKCIGDYWFFI
jgi:hypothetical protein